MLNWYFPLVDILDPTKSHLQKHEEHHCLLLAFAYAVMWSQTVIRSKDFQHEHSSFALKRFKTKTTTKYVEYLPEDPNEATNNVNLISEPTY